MLTHWSYVFLALTHRYFPKINPTWHRLNAHAATHLNVCEFLQKAVGDGCPIVHSGDGIILPLVYNLLNGAHHAGRTSAKQLMDLATQTGPLTHLPLGKMAASLADDNCKCIFFNENDRIPVRISLKFVPRSPIDNKPALVQVMACHLFSIKPLPEPMLAYCQMLTQVTDAYMWH